MVAEAPGYARMNYSHGGLYWHFTLKDNTLFVFDRVEFSESLYSL
jgi:hypothetical protein